MTNYSFVQLNTKPKKTNYSPAHIERNEKLSQFFSNYQRKGEKTLGILQSSLKNTSLQSFELEKLSSLSFLLSKGCLTKYSNYMSNKKRKWILNRNCGYRVSVREVHIFSSRKYLIEIMTFQSFFLQSSFQFTGGLGTC